MKAQTSVYVNMRRLLLCLCCLHTQSIDVDEDSDQNISKKIRPSPTGYVSMGFLLDVFLWKYFFYFSYLWLENIANSEDLDKILWDVSFHQVMHWLLR